MQAPAPFRLHWTANNWQHIEDTEATATALGIYFVDIPTAADQQVPIRFTQFWSAENRWEGRDYAVDMDRSA